MHADEDPFHCTSQEWAFLLPKAQNRVQFGAVFLGKSPENFLPWAVGMNGTSCTMQQL